MLYIPVLSQKAPDFSRGLYQLTRPPAVRDQSDVSAYYCDWVQHPSRPDVSVLVIPEQQAVPLHSAADGQLLEQTLSAFVPDQISAAEAGAVAAAIVDYAGQTISIADLIPQSWQPFVMTREQALAAGWIE